MIMLTLKSILDKVIPKTGTNVLSVIHSELATKFFFFFIQEALFSELETFSLRDNHYFEN